MSYSQNVRHVFVVQTLSLILKVMTIMKFWHPYWNRVN